MSNRAAKSLEYTFSRGWAKNPEPIKTLRYCEGHIWVAQRAREDGPKVPVLSKAQQQVRDDKAAYEQAKATQSPEMQRHQERFLANVKNILHDSKTDKSMYRLIFADLVLSKDKHGLIVVAPTLQQADFLRSFHTNLLATAADVSRLRIFPAKRRPF